MNAVAPTFRVGATAFFAGRSGAAAVARAHRGPAAARWAGFQPSCDACHVLREGIAGGRTDDDTARGAPGAPSPDSAPIPVPVPVPVPASDEERLAQLGSTQVLARRMSAFSNYAVSFTIISVLSGCMTLYLFGMNTGGSAVITWGWVGVGLMTLFVGLAMAEICSAYPTSAGLYFWSHRLAPPRTAAAWAWFTGWFLGFAAIWWTASAPHRFLNPGHARNVARAKGREGAPEPPVGRREGGIGAGGSVGRRGTGPSAGPGPLIWLCLRRSSARSVLRRTFLRRPDAAGSPIPDRSPGLVRLCSGRQHRLGP